MTFKDHFKLLLLLIAFLMKKTHIILLVLIAASIAVLISFMGNVTTYETVASARQKEGKFVNLIARLDMKQPIEYDPVKNPNYLSFTATDTLNQTIKVIYHNTKPTDMEKSERLVLKGTVNGDVFECKDILLKCPSKYKDDMEQAKKNLETTSR
jgi:cytochrome c-type biogenesis protein CcmE